MSNATVPDSYLFYITSTASILNCIAALFGIWEIFFICFPEWKSAWYSTTPTPAPKPDADGRVAIVNGFQGWMYHLHFVLSVFVPACWWMHVCTGTTSEVQIAVPSSMLCVLLAFVVVYETSFVRRVRECLNPETKKHRHLHGDGPNEGPLQPPHSTHKSGGEGISLNGKQVVTVHRASLKVTNQATTSPRSNEEEQIPPFSMQDFFRQFQYDWT